MPICLPADELLEPAVRLSVQRTERQWYSAVQHRYRSRRVQSAADQDKREEESDEAGQERSPFVFSSALRRSRTWFVDVAARIFADQESIDSEWSFATSIVDFANHANPESLVLFGLALLQAGWQHQNTDSIAALFQRDRCIDSLNWVTHSTEWCSSYLILSSSWKYAHNIYVSHCECCAFIEGERCICSQLIYRRDIITSVDCANFAADCALRGLNIGYP